MYRVAHRAIFFKELGGLFDNNDNSSKDIVMYDKQVHQIITKSE